LRIVAVIGAGLLPNLAEAQGVPRGEVQRGQTVENRPRADFDPLGVRLGAFRANAAAELGLGYDDNLFGTKNNRQEDGYGSWLAEGSVVSDWSRHAVGVTGRIEERRYGSENDLDWTDYSVGAFGRYDVDAVTNVEFRLNRVQEHLESSSVDVQEAGLDRPVPYAFTEAQVSGQTRFNRLGVLVIGNWRSYAFEDVDLGPATTPGGVPPGQVSRQDYDTWLAALGLSYELAPGRFVNLITRYQDIRYQDASQRGRDSQTYEVLAGFTYDFDGVWAARVAAGWRERDYESPLLDNLSGPAFEGEVIWQPTLLTTVTFAARRNIEESIRGDAVSYTRSLGRARVDHEYLRNIILGAELGVDYREYEQPSERATDGYGQLSARWLINRNLAVVGSYQHVRRLDSSEGLEEYARNLVQVRLRLAL
jgi:hypothetical protein